MNTSFSIRFGKTNNLKKILQGSHPYELDIIIHPVTCRTFFGIENRSVEITTNNSTKQAKSI